MYLAAPWVSKDLMPTAAKVFEDAGFEITHKWWVHDSNLDYNSGDEFKAQCAHDDFMGAYNADVLVLFHTAKSEGKAVEQGIALTRGIPIIAIGERGYTTAMNIFHWMPAYTWVNGISEAIDEVRKLCPQT